MKIYLLLFLAVISFQAQIYSVEYINYQYVKLEGKTPGALAWGYYEHDVLTDGWGKLYIWTSDTFDSHSYSVKTRYAAGYLEAYLTHTQIWQHQQSWLQYTFGNEKYTDELVQFFYDQDAYARKLISDNSQDDYYRALERILAQNDGMFQGLRDFGAKDQQLSWVDMQILQACGDIYELKEAYKPKTQRINWEELKGAVLEWEREKTISCSSLVRALDDWSDVIATHTTWTGYQNMLRIYKYYTFGGHTPFRVSFSAKPGLLYSKDDFYVLADQKLVVMETTNSILDSSLYDLITPESLLTWQRVPIANQLSQNGKQWTSTFVKHNSGTYNNQYIVVDYKTFAKDQPPTSDFIWISETIPGFYKTNDVTQQVIQNGNYWPSYNIPYDKEIYVKAGFQTKYEQEGDKYSYLNCPRGKIFSRDARKVESLQDMEHFIRYNDYQNDELSQGDPANAVASRVDLRQTDARAFGAIDGKIANLEMVNQNQARIQCGPTHDVQPVFSWEGAFETAIHYGQPQVFNFDWITIQQGQI